MYVIFITRTLDLRPPHVN
uniref:Uncharacterized protein n=1 Tax=Rhizophora mucronata TaxID=61149 RepID=A0A2P2II42_RHIMU